MDIPNLVLHLSSSDIVKYVNYLGLVFPIPKEYLNGYIASDANGAIYAYAEEPDFIASEWRVGKTTKDARYLSLGSINSFIDAYESREVSKHSCQKISDILINL